MKIQSLQNLEMLPKFNFGIFSKITKHLMKFCNISEIRAAQNCENLVDLEKC